MAADQWADSARQNSKPANARESSGVKLRTRTITFETAVADAALDVRRLFTVGAHEIPIDCKIYNDAIAGMTEVDLGLYRPGVGGAVVDRDALMDGTDLSAGYAYASAKNGLAALGVEEQGIRNFAAIANDVSATDVIGHLPNDSFDIGLCQVSDVTAVGTVTVVLTTIDEL